MIGYYKSLYLWKRIFSWNRFSRKKEWCNRFSFFKHIFSFFFAVCFTISADFMICRFETSLYAEFGQKAQSTTHHLKGPQDDKTNICLTVTFIPNYTPGQKIIIYKYCVHSNTYLYTKLTIWYRGYESIIIASIWRPFKTDSAKERHK